jgi:hypothetical protein
MVDDTALWCYLPQTLGCNSICGTDGGNLSEGDRRREVGISRVPVYGFASKVSTSPATNTLARKGSLEEAAHVETRLWESGWQMLGTTAGFGRAGGDVAS